MYVYRGIDGRQEKEREREGRESCATQAILSAPRESRVRYGSVLVQVRYGMCRATYRKLVYTLNILTRLQYSGRMACNMGTDHNNAVAHTSPLRTTPTV